MTGPTGRDNFGKSELGLDSQPKSVLEIAAKHYAQATRGRYVRSGRDTFGFGRDRQAERRFQEELRLECRSRSLPAFDKRCSASVVFLANFDSKYRSCVGLMVAVTRLTFLRRIERLLPHYQIVRRNNGLVFLPESKRARDMHLHPHPEIVPSGSHHRLGWLESRPRRIALPASEIAIRHDRPFSNHYGRNLQRHARL